MGSLGTSGIKYLHNLVRANCGNWFQINLPKDKFSNEKTNKYNV